MIGRIKGQLVELSDNTVLVDVGGVAYELEVTSAALAQLPHAGGTVQLYTHFVVREDAQLLYGFGSRDERDLFRALIRINGVGPKLGLSIISAVSLAQLARCVLDNDAAVLTKVPGVGRKTAERLLMELKDRLDDVVLVAEPHASGGDREAVAEAESALISLGYKPLEAQRAVDAVAAAGASVEQMVTAALKRAAKTAEATS
jgi:Holliday junction DNA helicase RuvA